MSEAIMVGIAVMGIAVSFGVLGISLTLYMLRDVLRKQKGHDGHDRV